MRPLVFLGVVCVIFVALLVALIVIAGLGNRAEFQKTFGVQATADVNLQAQEIPAIIVHVGALRRAAVDSWNNWLIAQKLATAITITPSSSLKDAQKASGLIRTAQLAECINHGAYYALTRACQLLSGVDGVPAYPAAALTACPKSSAP